MIDLTVPLVIVNVCLPAFQIFRLLKKGKIKHRNMRIILNIIMPEIMLVYDTIQRLASKNRKNQQNPKFKIL